jgi:bifunctional DNA-binding transcriptional regulator/antitoxin component of YhaV-PrlF toxin-antitoxin module
MATKTATVKLDENGRCTVPVDVRRALGINGEETYVEIEVTADE